MGQFHGTVNGETPALLVDWPVSGEGSAQVVGTFLKVGTTDDTDRGFLIPMGANDAGLNFAGVLEEAHATALDSNNEGTIFTRRKVCVNKNALWLTKYDQTDTMAASAANTTTTFTLTSLEDDIEGSWIYVVTGTGAGKLHFITASASGSCTLKTALDTGASDTYIKVLRRFHRVAKNTAAGLLGSDAAAGSTLAVTWDTYIQVNGGPLEALDPTIHDARNYSGQTVQFFSDIYFINHFTGPTSA